MNDLTNTVENGGFRELISGVLEMDASLTDSTLSVDFTSLKRMELLEILNVTYFKMDVKNGITFFCYFQCFFCLCFFFFGKYSFFGKATLQKNKYKNMKKNNKKNDRIKL